MSILIAEDMSFQRDYLRAIINDHFAQAGPVIEACDGKSAIELALEHRPSLVVLDIKMPELSGVKVARHIWSEMKLARIIFWSQYKDEIYVRELARIVPGETVYGYVLKSSPDEKLIAALRAVLVDEQCWIDPEIRTVQSRATSRASGLTDIEYEALMDIALGLTDKAIARRRYLSERGVQNRLRELYAKLSIDIEQIVDERWGNTYSPRSRAISIANTLTQEIKLSRLCSVRTRVTIDPTRRRVPMSGVEAPSLSVDQATDVLNSIKGLLRVALTSPTRTEPGQPVTATLVPASPEIDASDLAAGVLNLGLLTKNVVHTNKNVLDVPDSGDLSGDQLASTAALAGGQPFPLPIALPASTAAVTQVNIPGLLGQIFGTVSIPRLKVQVVIGWILRDQQGNELKDEEGAFIAPQGLTSPSVSLIIPPIFEEWRADTVKNPPTTVFCLSAKVTLTLTSTNTLGPFEVGPVPVILLPLLIPTVVVLCSEPNFGINTGQQLHGGDVTDDHIQEEDNVGLSSALIAVPEHSPFASAAALFKALRKVESAVDALSGLADFLGFFLPLGDLLSIPEQPRLRFSAADGIPKFSRIILKPKTFFFLTYDHDN